MESSSLLGATLEAPAEPLQHREWPPGDKTNSSAPQSDDEETTANCSEAMMSSEACEGIARQAAHSAIEQQRLQSGRNRLGTPRHELAGRRSLAGGCQVDHCDRAEGNDFALIGGGGGGGGCDGGQRERPDESSEPSLASGQSQRPPSYGTAARSCATLDVGQLQRLHLQRLAAQSASGSGGGGGQNCLQINHSEQTASSLNCVSLADLAAILNQNGRAPGASSQPIDDSYGFLAGRADKNQCGGGGGGGGGQRRPQLAQVGLVDLGAPSASLQRQLDLMAISGGGNVASLLSGSLAKKRDEGIYATLNVTQAITSGSNNNQQQQTQQSATVATSAGDSSQQRPRASGLAQPFQRPLPQALQINHAISAQASMQQQQQQQQLQRALQLQQADQQQQQQQQQQQIWVARGGVTLPHLNNQSNGELPRHLAPSYGHLRRDASDLLAASGGAGQQKWRAANDFDATKQTGAYLNGDNDEHDAEDDNNNNNNSNSNNRQQAQAQATANGFGGSSRQHRRRRHKSTSGANSQHGESCQIDARPTRGGGGGGGGGTSLHSDTARTTSANSREDGDKDAAKMDAAARASARATISAHCWLIDSGDDQDQRQAPSRGPGGAGPQQEARRLETKARLTQRTRHSQTLKPFNRVRAQRRLSGNFATLATTSGASTRSAETAKRRPRQVASTRSLAGTAPGTEPSDNFRSGRRRTAKSCGASTSSAYSNASAVVRLSAMLNFVSNLVSGKSRNRPPAGSTAASSKYAQCYRSMSTLNEHFHQKEPVCCLGPAAATIQGRYHGSGAASSLAYSSSTSAYVTGNSTLHSHDCGSSFVRVPVGSIVQQPVISNRAAFQTTTTTTTTTTAATTTGRLDQNSGPNLVAPITSYHLASLGPNSHHSYEYCDADSEHKPDVGLYDRPVANRALCREQIELATLGRERQSRSSMSSGADELLEPDSAASTCSPAQLVGLNQTGLIGNRLGGPTQLAQVVMSDNELIGNNGAGNSTASDCNCAERPRQCSRAARRRLWWWSSLRFVWPSNRPNSTDDDEDGDDQSLTRSRPAGPPNEPTCGGVAGQKPNSASSRQPQTRYRSLKSKGRSSGTLANVISLAKIDRVFRCRLLASLMVSAILFALICLLIVIILKRNSLASGGLHSSSRPQSAWSRLWPNFGLVQSPSPFESSYGDTVQLNLDEFDMSWLWVGSESADEQQQQQPHSDTTRWQGYGRQRHLADPNGSPPKHQTTLDANLKSLLHVIDRSERLEQFQTSLAHLSNLQLASDSHIDLVELAAEVLRASGPENNHARSEHENSTQSSAEQLRANRTLISASHQAIKPSHLDLFALTLLSNLHWPLVKWRHQSQQPSISSSFLSFASLHFGLGSAGPDGVQTVRSLLSALILVESLSSKVADQYANLRQIHKLHVNLRLIGYHLATCSQQPGPFDEASESPDNLNFPIHRRRFCALLVRRYTRMMLAMGQLDHQDLAELHRLAPVELPKSVYAPKEASATTATPRRNILNWLLDQLTPLDVHMLAEVALTSDFSSAGIASLPVLDHLDEQAADEVGRDADEAELVERRDTLELLKSLLVTNQDRFEPKSGSLARSMLALAGSQLGPKSDEKQEEGNLYELVETFVGDAPIKRLISTKATNQEADKTEDSRPESWQARYLNELTSATRYGGQWLEMLVYDLLSPWPSYRLPKFMQPRNYDLFLHPNLTTRLVLGVNKIEFELERPSRFLVLNCAHLNLIDLSVVQLKAPILNGSSTSPRDGQQVRSKVATDRQVAIRRALLIEQLELLYIELEEQLEPTTRLEREQNELNSLDFGELNAAGAQLSVAVIKNQFLLSVSFNKTNLMGSRAGQGLEFFRYADYFVPPTGSQPKESSPDSSSLSSSLSSSSGHTEEDESSLKALMFSTFNAEPPARTSAQRRRALASDSHQARQIVPCLDEVQFRARWQLNVVHDSNSQALSTGQRRERLPYNALGSLQMTIFEQLPVALSPNQFSILVCDLNNFRSLSSRSQIPTELIRNNLTSASRRQIQVQIWAQLEHLNQAELLSQLIPPLLAFYQTHLNFVYPLDKLDLVALPEAQDSNGATKLNSASSETRHGLGLLVLGAARARPLVDVNLISQELLERISTFVARQLAAQFLGNIVAPRSDRHDLWLFEALAEHLDLLALSQAQPEWHLDRQLQVQSLQEVLTSEQNDELAASAPIKLFASLNWSSEYATEVSQFERAHQGALSQRPARRSAAVVHMLLQTLLSSWDSRANLMQKLMQTFQYGSMSTRQFWRLFTRQLQEANLTNRGHLLPLFDEQQPFVTIYPGPGNEPEQQQAADEHEGNSTASEHVVFVNRRHQSATTAVEWESHRVQGPLGQAELEAGTDKSERTRPPTSRHRAQDHLELLANSWIERTGFPLIAASCHRDTLHLSQGHFRLAPKWTDESEEQPVGGSAANRRRKRRRRRRETGLEEVSETSWPIPLLFISRLNPKSARFIWFDRHEMELALEVDGGERSITRTSDVLPAADSGQPHSMAEAASPLASSPSAKLPQQYSWFKLNHNGSSLLRVNYDERNWEALISLLTRAHYSNHQLNPLDRANLLDDALTLMRFGHLSVNLAMNLTLYLELGERDYQPWQTIIRHFDQLQTLLNQNPLWHQYVLKLIQPISIVVGWKDDGPHLMRKLRRELYQLAIQYGDEKILARARHEFRQWAQKTSQFLVPNLQELVYVAGVRYGDQQEWFHCWQKYQQLMGSIERSSLLPAGPLAVARVGAQSRRFAEPKPVEFDSNDVSFVRSEQRQLLTALASTQNTWLLEQFLNYSLDPSKIQPFHLSHVVKTLGKNPVARLYLWRFVRLNWLDLLQRFGIGERRKWSSAQNDQQVGDAGEQLDATGDEDEAARDQPASILETMILESTKHFATRPDYDEVSTFFEAKIKAGQPMDWSDSMRRTVRASLATIRANIHWRDSIEPKLTRWLSHFNSLS